MEGEGGHLSVLACISLCCAPTISMLLDSPVAFLGLVWVSLEYFRLWNIVHGWQL
jgi:hypothetical protein